MAGLVNCVATCNLFLPARPALRCSCADCKPMPPIARRAIWRCIEKGQYQVNTSGSRARDLLFPRHLSSTAEDELARRAHAGTDIRAIIAGSSTHYTPAAAQAQQRVVLSLLHSILEHITLSYPGRATGEGSLWCLRSGGSACLPCLAESAIQGARGRGRRAASVPPHATPPFQPRRRLPH